jgi:hypothetical protein
MHGFGSRREAEGMNANCMVSMINRFITAELDRVYKRFNKIPDQEKIMIASFIGTIEEICSDSGVSYDPYMDYEKTKALAESLIGEEERDVVAFYLILKIKMAIDAELAEVKKAKEELEEAGCCKLRGYHFYHKHREDLMIEIAEDELDSKLDYSDEVVELFGHEELAAMWVAGTSKTEALRDYLRENNWWDVLDCTEPEECYTDSDGNELMFCYEGSGDY